MNQPIDKVKWVSRDKLRANNYNPNHVFDTELNLLKTSILEDGWTSPIVATMDGEIIDGYHRWMISKDPEIIELTDGLVPVVFIDQVNIHNQMISTIRHNRARGIHGILKMGDIIREIKKSVPDQEIGKRLGMEPEEIDRLSELRGSPELVGKDQFDKGWVPTRKK